MPRFNQTTLFTARIVAVLSALIAVDVIALNMNIAAVACTCLTVLTIAAGPICRRICR